MEEWKTIPECPDYAVSNQGRVKRVTTIPPSCKPGGRGFYPAIIKPRPAGRDRGYLQVSLRHEGEAYPLLVHILVAKAFIPNPENKPTVNHNDGNKTHNVVDNLSWATYHEQTEHAVQHTLIVRDSLTGRFAQKAG